MLEYIRIQNFKSLKDVTLNLKQINLLIGANNSGKSNLLKALEFVSNFIQQEERGQNNIKLERLFYNQILDKAKPLVFIIKYKYAEKDFFCHLIVPYDKTDIIYNYLPLNESLHSWQLAINQLPEFLMQNKHIRSTYTDSKAHFLNLIANLKIFKPEPANFHFDSNLPDNNSDLLASDCRNFIPFLYNLRENFRKNFHQLEKDLRTCLPDFYSISMPAIGGRLHLKLFTDQEEEHFFWADELSEGILYFLALLCIIHQPQPPKLLLLEEPEKGIHPRRISEIIRFIQQLAEDKGIQVIMTTHSPIVLNEFAYDLESIFVFDKEDKATLVRNLQQDIVTPNHQAYQKEGLELIDYQSDLGNYWLMGFLNGIPDEIVYD